MSTRNLLFFLLLFYTSVLQAQVCTNLGQNPGTAFPVCGSSVFVQTTVPFCGDREIPVPCIDPGIAYEDKNPYWYKFTCFTSGTLGFVITPNNLRDDYDWQVFDVTGHNPDEVYADPALFVACNWSGEPGKTGASAAGLSLQNCAGGGVPLFSAMPQLQQGHNYLLLVSHFSGGSQSGYSLEFDGGSTSIIDKTPPKLQAAKPLCDNRRISVILNKKMKCNTLAANGSDFIISDPSVTVTAASAVNCAAGFDMDSLIVTLSSPLPSGTYTLKIKKGSDSNTLLDNCDAAIPAGDSLSFNVFPSQPVSFDSITPPRCAPNIVNVIFSDPVLCSSVAPDGSDFLLTSSSSSVITGATMVCSGNVTTTIQLKLSAPILASGSHSIAIKKGTDGNTVLSECSAETPERSVVFFNTKNTVSAKFNYTIQYGCKADTGIFIHNGQGADRWNWQFGNNGTSTMQNSVYVFPDFGQQVVKLYVSNGTCSDSSEVSFNLDNQLKADFTAPVSLCPQDAATFKDTSIGKVAAWFWNFGNGSTSTLQNPPVQVYPVSAADKNYTVTLIVSNDRNCFDTAAKQVKILYNCFIGVATAFTPNGDGLNDYLYPINAYKVKNLIFKVYNRFGQAVFETTDFMRKWDGTFKGIKQQTGTYVWTLRYINSDSGKPVSLKGTTVLIR
jgi:gliding motility-associated-like protein